MNHNKGNYDRNQAHLNIPNNRTAFPIPPLQKSQNQSQQQCQNLKCKYVQNMLNAFKQFEHTHNANNIKDFVSKVHFESYIQNRFQLLTLFQQVQKLKDQVDKESEILKHKKIQKSDQIVEFEQYKADKNRPLTPNKKFLSQEKRINFESYNSSKSIYMKQQQQQVYINEMLQKEYEQLIKIHKQPYVPTNGQLNSASQVTSYQTSFANSNSTSQVSISEARQKEYLNQIQFTIEQMATQQQKITKQNQRLSNKLSSTPFYKQWVLMCKEAQGSRHFNTRLRQQLQKKKNQLTNLQKNV